MANKIRQYFSSPEQFALLLGKLARKRFTRRARKRHTEIHCDISSRDYSNTSFSAFLKQRGCKSAPCAVEQAEKYLAGKYDILGSGEITIGQIDWHKDYVSGFRWAPGTFYLDYRQEDIVGSSDVKWPREFSRCHQLLQVAVAYDMTGDDRYADFVLANMDDWIDENPLMYSINWGCTMDVAIRAVNWIWALALLGDAKGLTPERRQKIVASLYEHGWFVYHNPEKMGRYNHNHYLADLSGQVQLGLLFKDTDEGRKWLEEGTRSLYEEIRQQILPSGMSYERSVHYDRLVLELILVPVLLLHKNGIEVPQDIWCRLETMFDFLMCVIKPDGEAPIVGDQDNGRLLPFTNGELTDFRYLMSLGALLFGRADMKACGNGYNLYCHYLCAGKDEKDFEAINGEETRLSSRAFKDAGFYVLRQDGDYLLFNASGKGLFPELCNTTHTHSDLLSIELVSDGETFLCDAGTGCYTADAERRMLFRSTCMHNTATVDGESQNVLRKENLWDFERNAVPYVSEWSSDAQRDRIKGGHTGYLRLADPVVHNRMVEYDKTEKNWTIEDCFEAKGKHHYQMYFHFAPGIELTQQDGKIIAKGNHGALQFTFESDHKIALALTPTVISRSYGTVTDAVQAVLSVESTGNARIITLISKI